MKLKSQFDPFGAAAKDYLKSRLRFAPIKVYSNISGFQKIRPAYLFRNYKKMPVLEQKAMNFCSGKVLDAGAGAGSHSLFLQKKGYKVYALDVSPGCCEVMKKRGVENVVCSNLFDYSDQKFDTILMLMNGIGIAGNIEGLRELLNHCKSILLPGGQIIFDSSNIEHLFFEDDGSKWINLCSEYYGEVNYKVKYKKITGKSFGWLFIDSEKISQIANEEGFVFCKLVDGFKNDYLGKLYVK
jgi:SAM-dependent methyltransferase